MRAGAGGVGRRGAGRLSVPPELRTARLRLVPLAVDDAGEMTAVLADPALYVFTGGLPPTLADLEARYLAQVTGRSPDGSETWHNWIVRLADGDRAIGYVQATVTGSPGVADVAWVIGTAWQGAGYATEAARAMLDWLMADGVTAVTAHVHPGNRRVGGGGATARAPGHRRAGGRGAGLAARLARADPA